MFIQAADGIPCKIRWYVKTSILNIPVTSRIDFYEEFGGLPQCPQEGIYLTPHPTNQIAWFTFVCKVPCMFTAIPLNFFLPFSFMSRLNQPTGTQRISFLTSGLTGTFRLCHSETLNFALKKKSRIFTFSQQLWTPCHLVHQESHLIHRICSSFWIDVPISF